ncbi:Pentatricopeptide repeat-containing protein [Acorus gramineus]|uniref:Pentatricopeptide repeat-containing protein n=1 Tax=Acorus gramineus TaxID=55184 RepID=A0AAV9BUM4_ACOGR|nr:Pentatricopeptide repeat-containing protein [Acorus gramineus]
MLDSSSSVDSVHAHIAKSGLHGDVIIQTSLIVAHSNRSDVDSARAVFDSMTHRDVAAWNAMLSAYSRNGCVNQTVSLFRRMIVVFREGPNSRTLSILLGVCEYRLGKCVHAYARRRGIVDGDVFFCNSLLVFYGRCGDVAASEALFSTMGRRDLVSWNAMVSSLSSVEALETFRLMRVEGVRPDIITVEGVVHACTRLGDLSVSESVHGLLVRSGFPLDVYVENSLILMYCRYGVLESGRRLFDAMRVRNSVSWNILLNGYVRVFDFEEAWKLFRWMRGDDFDVSSEALVSAIQAAKLSSLVGSLHCLVIVMGFTHDAFVNSALVSAYGEVGLIGMSRKCCFDEGNAHTVSQNTLLSVFVQNGHTHEALELLGKIFFGGRGCDSFALVQALTLSTELEDLVLGKAIHGYVIRTYLESNVYVGSSLLEMYASCGQLRNACVLFSKMPRKNIVAWNTMISGCSRNGYPHSSLSLFHLLQNQDNGLEPDAMTVVGVIDAISHSGFDREAKYIHEYAIRAALHEDEYVSSSLIAMYINMGNIDGAITVLDKSSKLSTVPWNTMIAECAHHGLPSEAISVFNYVDIMISEYSLPLKAEHYASIVDLLLARGLIKEAFEFLKQMPTVVAQKCGWGALLGACRAHGDLEVGLTAAEKVLELEGLHCGYNVLLSNLYAEQEKWMDASVVRRHLGELGIKKISGWSMVDG